jgi:hypothetical protein
MIIKRFFENINVRLKKNVNIWWDLGVVGSLGLRILRIERDFNHYSSYLNCYIVTMFRKIMKFRQRRGIKDWVVFSRSSRWYSNWANLESEIKMWKSDPNHPFSIFVFGSMVAFENEKELHVLRWWHQFYHSFS